MKSFALGHTSVVRLDPGERIVASLTDLCARDGIRSGRLHGIGSVAGAVLGFFDRAAGAYTRITVEGDRELASLAGNVATEDGRPCVHAHVVLADAAGATTGGHLIEAEVAATCEIVLTSFADEIRRATDPATGVSRLDLEP